MGWLPGAALLMVISGAAAGLVIALMAALARETPVTPAPATLRRWLIAANILPALCGLAVLTLAAWLPTTSRHLLLHTGAHRPHLCLHDIPQLPGGSFALALLGYAALALLIYTLVRAALTLAASQRMEKALHAAGARTATQPPVVFIESDEPLCMCVGIIRPAIVCSTGLADLPAAQQKALLAHEQCHAAGRDNLVDWLLDIFYTPFMWLPTARRFRRAVRRAQERVCDEAAAGATSTNTVAELLDEFARRHTERHEQLRGDLADLYTPFAPYADPQARRRFITMPAAQEPPLTFTTILLIQVIVVCLLLFFARGFLLDSLACAALTLLGG